MGSLGRAAVPAAWSDSGSCTNRDSTMMLRLMLPVMLVSCLAGTSMGAQINRERREATFGAIVGGLASPFINFKQVCKEINYGYAEDTHEVEPVTYAPTPAPYAA